jgi:hypothetical protein
MMWQAWPTSWKVPCSMVTEEQQCILHERMSGAAAGGAAASPNYIAVLIRPGYSKAAGYEGCRGAARESSRFSDVRRTSGHHPSLTSGSSLWSLLSMSKPSREGHPVCSRYL